MILADHSVFKGFSLSLRNTKTLQFSVADVMNNISGTDINKDRLRADYNSFETEYWKIVEQGLSNTKDACVQIVNSTSDMAGKVRTCKSKIVYFLIHIFSYWTLSNATHFLEAKNANDSDDTNAEPIKSSRRGKISPYST